MTARLPNAGRSWKLIERVESSRFCPTAQAIALLAVADLVLLNAMTEN